MTDSWQKSPLGDVVKHGSIGPIWSVGREILRRIFVTVRDKRWQEIGPQSWLAEFQAASNMMSFSARHTSDDVAFEWQGTLQVSNGGRHLTFGFTGRSLKDMEVCRLGLVILHPVEWMVGAEVTAEDGDLKQRFSLSKSIAPQPIVEGIPRAISQPFSSLRIRQPGLGTLELQFEGELFELEDQRNWGDSSFKTYCTPLSLGFPRSVKAGTIIEHRLHLRFDPSTESTSAVATRPRTQARPIRMTFPKVGRDWPSVSYIARLGDREPPWRHFQFHPENGDDNSRELLSLLEGPSSSQVEIRIESQDDFTNLRGALSLLASHHRRVARMLVYGYGTSVPLLADLERLRAILKPCPALVDVPVLAATRGYFVEFNRDSPMNAPFAGIAFPLTATVHSDDADTITGNAATILDIADTAGELLQLQELAVAPLAFYYPHGNPPREFPANLSRPWLVASLVEAAFAGVTSITLSDDVIMGVGKLAISQSEPSLSALVECSGVTLTPVDAEPSLGVHAAILQSTEGAPARLLAANLNARSELLRFSGVKIEIPAFGTRLIEMGDIGRTT